MVCGYGFGVGAGGGGGAGGGVGTSHLPWMPRMPGEGGDNSTAPQRIGLDEKCSPAQNAGQWLGRNIAKIGALGTNVGLGGTAVGVVTTGAGIAIGATGDLPVGLAVGFVGLGIVDVSAEITAYSGLITVAGASISAISGSGKPAAVEGLSRLSTSIIPPGPIRDFASDGMSKLLNLVVPDIQSCKP